MFEWGIWSQRESFLFFIMIVSLLNQISYYVSNIKNINSNMICLIEIHSLAIPSSKAWYSFLKMSHIPEEYNNKKQKQKQKF